MKLTSIVQNQPINFADCVPDYGYIMLDVFDQISKYENITSPIDPEKDFKVHHSEDEPTNNFGGAFITSIFGSYLLHDIREEQKEWYVDDPTECTILFYSLTKIQDDASN